MSDPRVANTEDASTGMTEQKHTSSHSGGMPPHSTPPTHAGAISTRPAVGHRPVGVKVRETLDRVRSQLRKYVAIYAALIATIWVLFIFWFGGFLDFVPVTMGSSETPRWIRVGLLLGMAAGPIWALLAWATPRWLTRMKDRSIALLIERNFPSLDNHLLTAVELSQPSKFDSELDLQVSNPAAYQKMLDRVHEQLNQRIEIVDCNQLFDWRPIRTATACVVLAFIVTIAATLAMPSWMGHWSKRLFALSDSPWPRNAELRADGIVVPLAAFRGQLAADRQMVPFVDGAVRVPRGSAVLLQISAATENKVVPEVCTVFYRAEDGSRGRANMRRIGAPQDSWQTFVLDGPPLDGVAQSIEFDVLGLDVRLRDLRLEVVDPAVITDLNLELTYPEYLLSSLTRSQQETVPYRNGMRIPEGTQVRLRGKASAPLSNVDYSLSGSSSGPGRRKAGLNTDEASDSDANGVSDNSLAAQGQLRIETIPAEGREFEINLGEMSESHVIEIRGLDENGLSSDQIPRYVLAMQEDTIPEVASQLKGIGNAITPAAILPLEGTVSDDNGIAELWVELASSDGTETRVALEIPTDNMLRAEIDLQQLRENANFFVDPGDTLGFVVFGQDYFDLDDQPHLGRGQTKQLSVVTEDELLVILDRQELELRQRLEIIMDELQQLGETLDALAAKPLPSAWHVPQESNAPANVNLTPVALASLTSSLTALTVQSETDDDTARRRRMLAVRAQQSVLQGDKSQQELVGVAVSVDDLRLQLQNNRIDSYDRQARLLDKVHIPLVSLMDDEYDLFTKTLLEMQTASMSGDCADQASTARASLDAVLSRLESIKENMLDIESFNEIIDLVRGLLEDQEELLDATERKKQQSILDLLQQ